MDALPSLPSCIRSATEGYQWTQVKYGNSGAAVYRLDPQNGETGHNRSALYLKFGAEAVAQEIVAEADRLEWLRQYLPVPKIHALSYSTGHAWLLTSAIPGRNAYDSLQFDLQGRPAIVEALAHFLLLFHSLPIGACPFHNDRELKMIQARRNIDSGRVNEHDFDAIHAGWTAEQVWEEMHTLLPLSSDCVVAHGDFSLGNILIDDRKVTGCIDVGRIGTADRYQDLAILWNNLSEFGQDAQAQFLDAYGIATPDPHRLRFYLCLDELF